MSSRYARPTIATATITTGGSLSAVVQKLRVFLICGLLLAGAALPRAAEAQCNNFAPMPLRIETFGPALLQTCTMQLRIVPELNWLEFDNTDCSAGGSMPSLLIDPSIFNFSVPLYHYTFGSGSQDLPYPCGVFGDGPWQVDIDWYCASWGNEVKNGALTCGGRTFLIRTEHCQNGNVGDTVIEPLEQCDDGNAISNDGCSTWCEILPGWRCMGSPSSCSLLPCSDGVKTAGEACDDGNSLGNDGCSKLCTIEPTFTCTGSPSVCATLCGNGVVNPPEQCDDGARADGDGCSYVCQLEPETVSGTGGFFKVTTDENNDGLATASDPVETMVWTNGIVAPVTITESGPPATSAGYAALGVNVAITAPVATAGAPLVLQFVYDVSLYPAALNVNSIVIKRNGVTVPNCTGAGATPAPACVESRIRLLPSNDVQIRVRTVSASDWGASLPLCGVFADNPQPQLFVSDDRLKVKGVFALPSDKSFDDLAPWLRGARVQLEGASGQPGLVLDLPPGEYAGTGTRGWTLNGKQSSWKYRDTTGAAVNGITKLTIRDLDHGTVAGRVRVGVTGRDGDYTSVAADVPLHAVVDLGDATDAAAGLCGQTSAAP